MKLPKAYEPNRYESDIYALWERAGAFVPKEDKSAKPYSMVMPPPNANAGLHVGHASFMYADILARYHRLVGDSVLYLPGADHAGFETWVVYEKKLNQEGKTRFDFSREELYQQVWDFVQQNKTTFDSQFRMLGLSTDWNRFTFTLDDKVVSTAYRVFKKLWDDGLVYRGERIVNYCTHHGTSFSDIEVVYEEEKGKLYYTAYPLADGSGEVVVASSRPETKVGQSALMVNPNDKRYKHLIGAIVNQPLVPDVPIKIIADDYVDPDFGTGVVTVTPGHDPNDFEIARKHDLPIIELITHEGLMSQNVPERFRGMTVMEARKAVAEALDEAGYLRKVEDYTHKVGKCYKCGTVIEPLVGEQWFVRMRPLADAAEKAIRAGKITFYPKTKASVLLNYLKDIRDWNISRQIAWGIPIPAFQNIDNPDDWIFDERVDEQLITVGNKTYRRDPDVFDTWFSSGQWPYVTLGWPDNDDFTRYYPNSVMETGTDLLYQWVARMIMLGLYVTGKEPFETVYMHGMIVDEKGQKMSKSKGNVVDVMEAINTYGADAVRMGLTLGHTAGSNQPFGAPKFVAARNFANKLWNIARYVEDKMGDEALTSRVEPNTAADHWVLSKLQQNADLISEHLNAYRIGEAYDALYHFVWDDVADWYIEGSKTNLNLPLLSFVLESILTIAHPFAPFVTEAIWQTLHSDDDTMLITGSWPQVPKADQKRAAEFEEIKTIVTEVRYIVTALQAQQPSLYFSDAPFIAENAELIRKLAKLARVAEVESGKGMHLTTTKHDAWLDIDISSAQGYIDKLTDDRTSREASISRLTARLANKAYTENAPKEIVAQTRQQLAEEKTLLEKLEKELSQFRSAFGA